MSDLRPIGVCSGGEVLPLEEGLQHLSQPLLIAEQAGRPVAVLGGTLHLGGTETGLPVHAFVPAGPASSLGAAGFRARHGIRLSCYAGAMANGIASEDLVIALGKGGVLAFFGAAGLSPARITEAIQKIKGALGDAPFGFNLINSPNEPAWQEAVADLYIEHGIRCVEASAYVSLSLPLIKYRVHGIHRDDFGKVIAPNRVVAKLSRVEVAERFLSPPPEKMLAKLVEQGAITPEQAALAKEIPVAADITMEADSGGHTDHRPAITALPAMLALRDAMQAKYNYPEPLHVGLGGGIATPWAAAAAFAMGADYVVTGSINQACVESGTSTPVREMLAAASQTDVGEAPAADMFEMGVTVQVLKKGTRFTIRGAKLFETYKAYPSLEAIPPAELEKLEKDIFRAPVEQIWEQTRIFFAERDPRQIEKADKDPRYKMALVFRWYLGQASSWAKRGTEERREDYQVWCGPAMGAFNEWTAGSFLARPEARRALTVTRNLLHGAALVLRRNAATRQGVPGLGATAAIRPLTEQELEEAMAQ